jgi:ABC-2 type transport system ATP-binding protein
MRALLKELHVETFLLDTRQTLTDAPALAGYAARLVDEHTLEVQVDKAQGLNALFAALTESGIEVVSMRNKSNRLEELFLTLVDENAEKKGA